MIDVKKIVTGFLEENCYIINNGKSALIVDPGSDYEKIIDVINQNNLSVKGILITHYHFDHVGVLDKMKDTFKDAVVVDYKSSGEKSIDEFSFKIIQTFGHTLDSVSYYFERNDVLFTGDFVFKGTIGNFAEDNEEIMANSLNIFKYMPSNVVIYPGHGEDTTVKIEKETNPFLRGI